MVMGSRNAAVKVLVLPECTAQFIVVHMGFLLVLAPLLCYLFRIQKLKNNSVIHWLYLYMFVTRAFTSTSTSALKVTERRKNRCIGLSSRGGYSTLNSRYLPVQAIAAEHAGSLSIRNRNCQSKTGPAGDDNLIFNLTANSNSLW